MNTDDALYVTSYVNETLDENSSESTEVNWDDVIQFYSYTNTDKIIISIFMPIIVILGVIGNALTIIVIAKHARLRTSVNVYLANLAIADLLTLLLAPDFIWTSFIRSPIHDVFDHGVRNLWLCRVNLFVTDTAIQVAIFTIFWMSVERYMAICHPLKFRNTKFGLLPRSVQICCLMWILTLAWQARKLIWITIIYSQFPWPDMYNNVPNSAYSCAYCDYVTEKCDLQRHLYVVDTFLSLTFIIIVVGLYTAILISLKKSPFNAANSTGNKSRSKSEKKVFQTVFLTVTIYVIFMGPFGILNLILLYSKKLDFNAAIQIVNTLRVVLYTNSSVNPIIYNAVNKVFRQAFLDVFCFNKRKQNTRKNTTNNVSTMVSTATSNPAYVHEN